MLNDAQLDFATDDETHVEQAILSNASLRGLLPGGVNDVISAKRSPRIESHGGEFSEESDTSKKVVHTARRFPTS